MSKMQMALLDMWAGESGFCARGGLKDAEACKRLLVEVRPEGGLAAHHCARAPAGDPCLHTLVHPPKCRARGFRSRSAPQWQDSVKRRCPKDKLLVWQASDGCAARRAPAGTAQPQQRGKSGAYYGSRLRGACILF